MTPVAAHWSAFNFPLVFPCQLPQDLPTFGSRLAPRKACATFEGHLRVQMCFVADSSKWRGDVCKACKCSSHPSRRRWERKKCCSQIGTNYMGPWFKPKDSVLIGDHLIFVGSHIVYLKDTLETKVGTQSQRMELRRVFFHGFHRFFIGQTRRNQGFFWRFQIASDPI
jgi:hypothetical protein